MKILSTVLILAAALSASAAMADVISSNGSVPDMTGPEVSTASQVFTQADIPAHGVSGYPQRASDDEIEGAADASIQVGQDGRPVKCVVISETPAGYGFGRQFCLLLLVKSQSDMKVVAPGQWLKGHMAFTLK